MPIYEYLCPNCKNEFELIRPFAKANEPAPCPQCGSPGEKLISSFAHTVGFGIVKVPKKPAFRKKEE